METYSFLRLLSECKVVIPPIQRDYAQGRTIGKTPKKRELFLNAILKSLNDNKPEPLKLDFIYGHSIKASVKNGANVIYFTPLDGQQRLTTLFLLHWYAAALAKSKGVEIDIEVLKNFSYETRNSSRNFCEKLVDFTPKCWNESIKETIINENWFLHFWLNDPTINSMLVMLDAIQSKFNNFENLWEYLYSEKPKIVFYKLSMEELGLQDDLYIKMNSRGKELTDFEYFKSQFSELLDDKNKEIYKNKIDSDWSDLFWNRFKDSNSKDIALIVDSGFLSYFWFITDIIIVKQNINITTTDTYEIIKTVYKDKTANVSYLFDSLDIFVNLYKNNHCFFDNTFYLTESEFSSSKTRLFFPNANIDLFKKCAEFYGYEDKKNNFIIAEQLLLYACIFHLKNETFDFNRRIRKIRNLIINSEDNIRKDFFPSLLEDVESILSQNILKQVSKFSDYQIVEENNKEDLINKNNQNTQLKNTIYKLEDHDLLRGTIRIFNIDDNIIKPANTFAAIFFEECDYIKISLAILTISDYTQNYGKYKRFGNRNAGSWRDIFRNNDVYKTNNNLKSLIAKYLNTFSNSKNNDLIVQDFLNLFVADKNKERDVFYYYIKYSAFIHWYEWSNDGYYYWNDFIRSPYDCFLMYKYQFNGRHWSPFLLAISQLNKNCNMENEYGGALIFKKDNVSFKIYNKNNGFFFKAIDNSSQIILDKLINSSQINNEGVLVINQNDEGIDTEDRIVKCNDFLNNLITN